MVSIPNVQGKVAEPHLIGLDVHGQLAKYCRLS